VFDDGPWPARHSRRRSARSNAIECRQRSFCWDATRSPIRNSSAGTATRNMRPQPEVAESCSFTVSNRKLPRFCRLTVSLWPP
jgi:hypothetical protein